MFAGICVKKPVTSGNVENLHGVGSYRIYLITRRTCVFPRMHSEGFWFLCGGGSVGGPCSRRIVRSVPERP